MKTFIVLSLLAVSFSSMAKDLYSECTFQYKSSENTTVNPVWFHNAGKFSINDCMNEAIAARELSISDIKFKYAVFTKVTLSEDGTLNTDIGSEGWSLTGEIDETRTAPQTLKFEEFVNP